MRLRLCALPAIGLLTLPSHAEAQPPRPPLPNIQSPASADTEPVRGSGLILGRVADAGSGRPIAAAIVSIFGGGLGPQTPQVLADNEGRFLFRDLPKGSYSIRATKEGYLAGAFGARRPGGPGQQIELDEGERVAAAPIAMWKHAAIEGMVVDEAGEPVPGVTMRAYVRTLIGGRRTWRPAGTSSGTDDRGIYRIWSLTPGDYVVGIESTTFAVPVAVTEAYQGAAGSSDPARTALIRELVASGGGSFGQSGVRIGDLVRTIDRAPTPPPTAPEAPLSVYPTTFYPAAATFAAATIVMLRSGEERIGIDMQVRPAPAVRVSGTLTGPDGSVPNVAVRLVPDSLGDVTSFSELSAAATVSDANGAFTLLGVTPGQYTLRVAKVPLPPSSPSTTTTVIQTGTMTIMSGSSSDVGSAPPPLPSGPTLWATVPIAVGTRDLSGVMVALQTGARISGRLEFDGIAEKPTAEQLQRTPIMIEPADGPRSGVASRMMMTGRVDANGHFTTMGLVGGRYFIRVYGAPPGWTFKSATSEGRDLEDTPLDVGGSDISGVVITFTDRPAELSGRVTGDDGNGDGGATVLIFPAETSAWSEHGLNSRRIRTVRTSPAGAYSTRALPPGDYYAIAVPDELAGDWQDPKSLEVLARDATAVRIDEGEKNVQSLRTKRVIK